MPRFFRWNVWGVSSADSNMSRVGFRSEGGRTFALPRSSFAASENGSSASPRYRLELYGSSRRLKCSLDLRLRTSVRVGVVIIDVPLAGHPAGCVRSSKAAAHHGRVRSFDAVTDCTADSA